MKIKELNIIEFGGLKDRKISFGDGMNIISGANEAGKSTVMLFIKYMLYGLPRKSASNPERERAVSLDGKRASGSMMFEARGRRYIAERHFQGTRGRAAMIKIGTFIILIRGTTVQQDIWICVR